jgi:hypothetical protein
MTRDEGMGTTLMVEGVWGGEMKPQGKGECCSTERRAKPEKGERAEGLQEERNGVRGSGRVKDGRKMRRRKKKKRHRPEG